MTKGSGPRLTALAAVAVAGLAPVARADWPVYGHDASNSRNAGADGPGIHAIPTFGGP
jgi:hypothetical protein